MQAGKDIGQEIVAHQPGSPGAAARRLADARVNIEAFYVPAGGNGGVSIVFVVDDIGKAQQAVG